MCWLGILSRSASEKQTVEVCLQFWSEALTWEILHDVKDSSWVLATQLFTKPVPGCWKDIFGGLHVFSLQCFEKLSWLQYCRTGSVVAITPSYLECEVCLHSWQEVKWTLSRCWTLAGDYSSALRGTHLHHQTVDPFTQMQHNIAEKLLIYTENTMSLEWCDISASDSIALYNNWTTW